MVKEEKRGDLDTERRRFLQQDWDNDMEGWRNMRAELFWSKVSKLKRNDEFSYPELSSYALSVLSVPCSNAFVERIFSTVTFLKSKLRNRMLNSILFVQSYLQARHFFYTAGVR